MATVGKRKAAVVLIGLIAAAGISAPAAQARTTCEDQVSRTVCQSEGSVSIKSTPQTRGSSGQTDPNSRVGSNGRRGCYTQAFDRDHLCN